MKKFYNYRLFRLLKFNYTLEFMQESFEIFLAKFTSNVNKIKGIGRLMRFALMLALVGQIVACLWMNIGWDSMDYIHNLTG